MSGTFSKNLFSRVLGARRSLSLRLGETPKLVIILSPFDWAELVSEQHPEVMPDWNNNRITFMGYPILISKNVETGAPKILLDL